jgi:hypothetical protein
VLLIKCLWDFRIFKHSNAERRADGEPLVNVSAREDSSISVPSRGLLKSVFGRFLKS